MSISSQAVITTSNSHVSFQMFSKPTKQFSEADVPLVCNVLPLLFDLKQGLEALREDLEPSPVLRVAAHAALMMIDKYTILSEECEIYYFAIRESLFIYFCSPLIFFISSVS